MNMKSEALSILGAYDIKPTPNRLLVVEAMLDAQSPLSLIDLETLLGNIERSSILRVLMMLKQHNVVRDLQDGRGISKYEIVQRQGEVSNAHVHFYCESCQKTFCFEEISIPQIEIPENFVVSKANYMLKGTCPKCSAKR